MNEPRAVRRRRSRAEVEALVAEFEGSGLVGKHFADSGTLQWERWINIVDVFIMDVRMAGLCFMLNWFRQSGGRLTGAELANS